MTLKANTFHRLDTTLRGMLDGWQKDIADLARILSPEQSPDGVDELSLLGWFGQSKERICLLAYITHHLIPTHVARECQIGCFRTDFAWVALDRGASPTVGLIELENCERHTLFDGRRRNTPHIGDRFLGGFAQLVDWCAFGYAETEHHGAISALIGKHRDPVRYVFSLVVGLRRFSDDRLSIKRTMWWDDNIKLGRGTSTMTYDVVCGAGQREINTLLALRDGGPPSRN